MLISRRLVIGLLLVLAIGVFAIVGPVAGSTASADGGFVGIKCEDDECLRLTETSLVLSRDSGFVSIKCEDDECLRLTSASLVFSKDGGIVGIKCEDDECL